MYTPHSLPKLKPSSIDERIRKACQCPKICAILKYLPRASEVKPHPYACWFNSCENCADWTLTSGVSCSLDASLFKEGGGSLRFISGLGAVRMATLAVTRCAEYMGLWIYIPTMAADADFAVVFYANDNNWYRDEFKKEAGIAKYSGEANVQGYFFQSGWYNLPAEEAWYWLEFRRWAITTTNIEFWMNGTKFYDLYTARYWEAVVEATFQLRTFYDTTFDVRLDYIRSADRQEYPPT